MTARVACPARQPDDRPFSVEGAEPGDALIVKRSTEMMPNRKTGWTATYSPVSQRVVDPPRPVADLPKSQSASKMGDRCRRRHGQADPAALERIAGWSLPLTPMSAASASVARPSAARRSTATSGPYRGSVDYRRFARQSRGHIR